MGRLWLNVWHTDEKNVAGRQTFPDCSSGLEGLVSVGQWCECSYWEWRNVGEVDDAVAKSGTGTDAWIYRLRETDFIFNRSWEVRSLE